MVIEKKNKEKRKRKVNLITCLIKTQSEVIDSEESGEIVREFGVCLVCKIWNGESLNLCMPMRRDKG